MKQGTNILSARHAHFAAHGHKELMFISTKLGRNGRKYREKVSGSGLDNLEDEIVCQSGFSWLLVRITSSKRVVKHKSEPGQTDIIRQ